MYYPQKPLIKSKLVKYLRVDELPHGINATQLQDVPVDTIKKIVLFSINLQLKKDYLKQLNLELFLKEKRLTE